MAIADGIGLPISVHTAAATPHEVTLVEPTISECFVPDEIPERLIGDKAYDSDPLDAKLALDHGIELVAPHKSNRQEKSKTQDGRLASLQTQMEGRKALCMASEFPSNSGTL